jgi:hypothetical protein
MTLKNQVEYCLDQYPETRNNDIDLMIKVWTNFTPINEDTGQQVKIHLSEKGNYYIALKDLHWLQREDHIKRIRAKIQNEEKRFLPTNQKVADFRKRYGRGEKLWRNELGYNQSNN